MWRALSYFLIPVFTFSVVIGLWVIVGAFSKGDFKGAGAMLFLVAWWSWAAVSAYARNIKQPREEKKRLCIAADEILSKTIVRGATVGGAVKELREIFPIEGEPRYRDGPTPLFDTTVELETRAFIISLFGKDGTIQSWNVR